MARNEDFCPGGVLPGRVEDLCRQAENLCRQAEEWEKEGGKAKGGLLSAAGAMPTNHPGATLYSGLKKLRLGLCGFWNMQEEPVEGLNLYSGSRRMAEEPEWCKALDAWNPLLAASAPPETSEEEAPRVQTEPLMLWPKTREDPLLRAAAEKAGIRVIEVLPFGAKEGFSETCLSAEKALHLYQNETLIFLCTALSCLPYADAFPHKLLWLAPPEDPGPLSGESYDILYLRASATADAEASPGATEDEIQKQAKELAALYALRKNAGACLVLLSSANYGDPPSRPWHLAHLAAQTGRRVLYISAGTTAEKTKLLHRSGNLWVFELAAGSGEGRLPPDGVLAASTPDRQRVLAAGLSALLAALHLQRAILQVEHPFWAEAAFSLRRSLKLPILFDLHDDFSLRQGAAGAELHRAEKSLLAGADFVTAASSALAKRAGQRRGHFATVRNGCHAAHFEAGIKNAPPAKIPVLGFYGAIGPTFSFEAIRALNDSGMEVEIRLIGRADDEARKRLQPLHKVRLLDELPYERLPKAIAEFDLALLPYNPKSKSIEIASPAKFYEYLAAGKAIVGTSIPELMVFRGRYACLEGDPGWFVRRVRECLDGISLLANTEERVQFARQNDWQSRADDFTKIYDKLEIARGRAIRGDIWAEQAAFYQRMAPETPMLALPPAEKKKKGDDIPKMQLAAAMATLREMEDALAKKDAAIQEALNLLKSKTEAPLASGVLKSLGLAKNQPPSPAALAQKQLEDSLRLDGERLYTAFSAAPGGSLPVLATPYTRHDLLFFACCELTQNQNRGVQLARLYAENGHRVFYISPRFSGLAAVSKQRENLYLVELPGQPGCNIFADGLPEGGEPWRETLDALLWHLGIRDALAVVAHPRWAEAAFYLRGRFGIKMVVDCHGDFTGFLVPGSSEGEEDGIRLLREADVVIPTTGELASIARQIRGGEAPETLPNGCDFSLFNACFAPSKPCPPPSTPAEGNPAATETRPVIGFCGLISHWFDAEALCAAASALPWADFVLAGPVLEWKTELGALPNIRLLGEKNHAEIPALVQSFDLAILPFDPAADICAGLSPSFFYEALAAGKKVVAANLPALRPYAGKQALLAETPGEYEALICQVLKGEDGLAPAEEGAALAQVNDWKNRWQAFAALANRAMPKVSVILTGQNCQKPLQACLASLFTQTALPRYEVIVVDRGSTDGTREMLQELETAELAGLRAVLLEGDKSNAAAQNAGIREATGDYVVLLQNNVMVTRGWLAALLAHMERDDELCLCGPVTNLGDGEAKVPVFYRSADEMAQFAYLYTWQHLGESRCKDRSLSLFCAMLRRSALTELGPLDENYTGEFCRGQDLAQELQKLGKTLAVAEDAFVHCMTPPPFSSELSPEEEALLLADKKHFEEKWSEVWKPRPYRTGVTREMNQDSHFSPEALLPLLQSNSARSGGEAARVKTE